MSGAITSTGGNYSTLAEILISSSTTSRSDLTTLEEQSASGYIAQTYGGIGAASQTLFDLGPQVSQITAWQANIDSATTNMSVTQNALSQIASIAQSFYGELPSINNSSANNIDSVAADAKSALSEVASLLDTTNGGVYVFSGDDSANPPISDPDAITSTGFYAQISTATASLSALGADGVMSAAISAASSNASDTTPFSSYLSQTGQATATMVAIGENQMVQTGLLANSNTLTTSSGNDSTGSYMRDILMSLSVLSSLNSSQSSDTGLPALISGLQSSLGGAMSALSTEQGVLGDSQTRLGTIATNYTDLNTSLSGQISNVQDANLASVSTQLQSVQTQLTASYQLIANLKSLSLTNYL